MLIVAPAVAAVGCSGDDSSPVAQATGVTPTTDGSSDGSTLAEAAERTWRCLRSELG